MIVNQAEKILISSLQALNLKLLNSIHYLRTMFSANRPKLDPEDYYMSEEGYIVFTEKYHLKRGYCCKSGCRHCPYGYNKKTGRFDKKES